MKNHSGFNEAPRNEYNGLFCLVAGGGCSARWTGDWLKCALCGHTGQRGSQLMCSVSGHQLGPAFQDRRRTLHGKFFLHTGRSQPWTPDSGPSPAIESFPSLQRWFPLEQPLAAPATSSGKRRGADTRSDRSGDGSGHEAGVPDSPVSGAPVQIVSNTVSRFSNLPNEGAQLKWSVDRWGSWPQVDPVSDQF